MPKIAGSRVLSDQVLGLEDSDVRDIYVVFTVYTVKIEVILQWKAASTSFFTVSMPSFGSSWYDSPLE